MEAIRSSIAGTDFDTFNRDPKTKSAVLAQLAIMGEAAKLLPESTRTAHTARPWSMMTQSVLM